MHDGGLRACGKGDASLVNELQAVVSVETVPLVRRRARLPRIVGHDEPQIVEVIHLFPGLKVETFRKDPEELFLR